MRVLQVTDSYWPNMDGGALFERRLAVGLATRGHVVTVWAPSADGPARRERDGGADVWRARSRRLLSNPRYRIATFPPTPRRLASRLASDVVHIHNPGPLGRHALREALRQRIPVVMTNHLMADNVICNSLLRYLPRPTVEAALWRTLVAFLNRSKVVVSPSEFGRQTLAAHGLRVASSVITNGVDVGVFGNGVVRRLSQPLRLLYLGRVDAEKGVRTLVEAVLSLPPRLDVVLTVAGEGKQLPALRSMARAHRRAARITFLGRLAEDDKPAVFLNHNVFCIGSAAELQSIACLEAMASRLPVIAARAGALPETTGTLADELMFIPGDVADCRRAIIYIAGLTQADLDWLGTQGRNSVLAYHTNELMLSAYEALLHAVVNGRL